MRVDSMTTEAPLQPRTRQLILAVMIAATLLAVALRDSAPFVSTVALLGFATAAVACSARDIPFGLGLLVLAAALDTGGVLADVGILRFTVYQVLAVGVLGIVLVRLRSTRTAILRTPLDMPVLAFIGVMALTVAFAGDRAEGVVQLARLLSSAALAFMVVQVVRDQQQARSLVWTMLAVAAVLGALAVAEWAGLFALRLPVLETAGYGIRARTTFHDPNIFGSFLVSTVLFAMALGFTLRERSSRVLVWLGIGVTIVGVAVTYSRGSLAGLLFGSLVVVLFSRLQTRARVLAFGAVGLLLVAVGLFAVDAAWVQQNVVDLRHNESVMGRVRVVEGAWEMWLDHPMGVGLGNFPLVYPEYQTPGDTGVIESHTAYVTVLAEGGILGALAYLWLLWRFFSRAAGTALHSRSTGARALAAGALGAGAALCAQSLTYSLEASKFLWLTFGLGAAAWAMGSRDADAGMLGTTDPVSDGSDTPSDMD